MIDSGGERHFGWLEWIIRWEMNGEEKDTPLVRTFWGAHDGGLPMKQVVSHWSGTALGWRVPAEVLEFLK